MKKIDSREKTIEALLDKVKYNVDYYQREYIWQTKHVSELINDLTNKFAANYRQEHELEAVKNYGHYFLGSIIISENGGERYIVDGQQRLTTLTLLLIRIHRLLDDADLKGEVATLIFSRNYGRRSFNLNIEDREPVMEALYEGKFFDEAGQPESIRNIAARYTDIEKCFDLQGEALPYFVDWLLKSVYFVEITAYTNEDAYTIFETMNDRGLSLTPTEMLKGYLLANITIPESRAEASAVWRKRIQKLKELGRGEDAEAIETWLRSQHAKSIRERTRGAEPRDFEDIGSKFHRWIQDHKVELGLTSSAAFTDFIKEDFAFYTHWYLRLKEAAKVFTTDLECVYYNAQHNFTLQYPFLLAPLQVGDSDDEVLKKLRIGARYLDILIHRRIWNRRSIGYSNNYYGIFSGTRRVRGKSVSELTKLLSMQLKEKSDNFSINDSFQEYLIDVKHFTGSNRLLLSNSNRPKIRCILARITAYVEMQSTGQSSRYIEFCQTGDGGYEIEHIWANRYERHTAEFDNEVDFQEYRNRIGGLLLLPKRINASLSDMPYEKKREHYIKENALAASLHEHFYEHRPGFHRFIEQSGLPFRAHAEFTKDDLDERQRLYQQIAEQIWHPDRLLEEAS